MQYTQYLPQRSVKKWDSSNLDTRFTTALEASKILDDLVSQARQLNYNKDLRKLLENAHHMVGELGNAEVRARQSHKAHLTDTPRQELAQAIDYCEKMLLILRLTQ